MKERPILFSAPMVRALLAGTKTQTRRIVKPQPVYETTSGNVRWYRWRGLGLTDIGIQQVLPLNSPYGQPVDRLWVRETWADIEATAPGRLHYRASGSVADEQWFKDEGWKWRPSIFMPRHASRLTLEITGVRVERLQDISEADAKAEGVTPMWEPGCSGRLMDAIGGFSFRPAASAYANLWESINGPGSWDANPWVWVVEFRRVDTEVRAA